MKIAKPALGYILTAVSVTAAAVMFFVKPIAQPEAFHQFADKRQIFSVANGWNVLSNLLFFIIGLRAMLFLRKRKLAIVPELTAAYYCFFSGVLLVAFGSAWYHYYPDNSTLVWDRLPMTIAFMSLLSFALAEFFDVRTGRRGLIPFLCTGIFSIAWWQYGELHQHGDLRLYMLVQFLPMILLLLLLLFGQHRYQSQWGYWALLFAYILAKLAEHFDTGIYSITGQLIAGHLVKHILSACGLWLFLSYLRRRERVSGLIG